MAGFATLPHLLFPAAVLAFVASVLLLAAVRMMTQARDLAVMLRSKSSRQLLAGLAGIMGFFSLLYWMGEARKEAQADILRRQFLLPKEVTWSGVRISKHSSATRPSVEAIVHFSERQFEDYAGKVEDQDLWKPRLLSYNGTPVVSYSAQALRWRDLPMPAWAGDRRLRWGSLSHDQGSKTRNGKALCLALRKHSAGGVGAAITDYTAHACSEFSREESPGPYVIGILDYDTRTLHMRIN